MLTDWIELCGLLSAHRVDFLVVGGQAVIAHGYARRAVGRLQDLADVEELEKLDDS